MNDYDTKFVETNALLAALNEDEETLRRLLGQMLPGERARLRTACNWLVEVSRFTREEGAKEER